MTSYYHIRYFLAGREITGDDYDHVDADTAQAWWGTTMLLSAVRSGQDAHWTPGVSDLGWVYPDAGDRFAGFDVLVEDTSERYGVALLRA